VKNSTGQQLTKNGQLMEKVRKQGHHRVKEAYLLVPQNKISLKNLMPACLFVKGHTHCIHSLRMKQPKLSYGCSVAIT
jgi:hypothetical protein